MKIIFMGTPDFACPALKKIIADKNFEIVAIYSREPQPAGRGHKLSNSPIHNLALQHNLKIITPKTLKDPAIQQEFISFKADIAVVVAYGMILPQEILNGTKFGCINIHPSALPKWRGAAPIQRTIMNGDNETAVDIIKMDRGVDSGDIILSQKISLNGEETYASLAPQLAEIGASLLIQALNKIKNNDFTLSKQDALQATYAKKIEKTECEINWQDSAINIERKIRALNGNLGAYFNYNDEKIKVFAAKVIDDSTPIRHIGSIDEQFHIQCGHGVLRPSIIQRPGKNPIKIEEFLLGKR